LKELVAQPTGLGVKKSSESTGSKGQVSLRESLKLQCGFVVKHNCIDIGRRKTRLSQTKAKRIDGESLVVFYARETFFLCGRSDCAVNYEGCCSIVVVRRDSENPHSLLTLVLVGQRTLVNRTWRDEELSRDVQNVVA
jgi:hypothetical protein